MLFACAPSALRLPWAGIIALSQNGRCKSAMIVANDFLNGVIVAFDKNFSKVCPSELINVNRFIHCFL